MTVLARTRSKFIRPISMYGSCMIPRVVRQSNVGMSPGGPGSKNDYAGEGQQQLTRPTNMYGTVQLYGC
jgi:hypothetical protein